MLAFLRKNRIFIFLLGVILLSFNLRTVRIQRDLLFHIDQASQATDIYKIWHDGKISLLGHAVDVEGLNHAPIYYWLMTPAYFLSKGDPAVASIFQILLEVLSLPFLYFALERFFNRRTAVATLILYSVSYGMISQSRWLVNVTPILAFTNILLFLLAKQSAGKIKPLLVFLTSLLVGIITQHDGAIGIFLFPFLIWFYRKKLNPANLGLIFCGFLLPAIPLIVFQFRHNFVFITALLRFFSTPGRGLGFSFGIFGNNLAVLLRQINVVAFYPLVLVSSVLFILGLIRLRKLKTASITYAYFLIPFIFLGFFQRGAIGFFYDAMMPLAIAVVIYSLDYFPKIISFFLFWTILVVNLLQLPYIYKPTNALIPIGNGNVITLQDRKNIIDWMYQKAEGKPFSVWYYTIPYYLDQPWDYLFTIYGQPKYGYMPEATHGFSPNDLKVSKLFFAVYETEYDENRKATQIGWLKNVKKNFGGVNDSYRSNDVIVQLRSWKPKAK